MFGLSFLAPLFLVGAAAAATPIAIHLFYRRTDPVIEFAAMRYLRQAPVEETRRRRLRELILLALRVTALLLLAWAFARPYLAGAAAALTDAGTIVLVDTSASQTAPGQFDRVRARATQAIRQAPAGHAVGVLSFAHAAEVVVPLSHDRAGALAAIGQLRPGAGATRYRAALQRAGEELGGRSGRIVVVTDLQQSGWDAASGGGVPENVEVVLDAVEGTETNVAITSLRLESGDAVAVVQNFSPRPAADQVVFAIDDQRIGAIPVTLAPGGSAEARLTLQTAAGILSTNVGRVPAVRPDAPVARALSASITDRAGYAADNLRYAVLDGGNGISVMAVTATGNTSEALYLERAVTVVDGAGGFRFQTVSGAAIGKLDAQALADVDVIVILGTRGLEQRGRERLAGFVKSGGGLLISAGPDVEEAVLRQALNGVIATSWRTRQETAMSFAPDDARHPVFRPFGGVGALGNVSFTRAVLLDPPGDGSVIARYTDGTAAVVEERTSGGRVIILGSDLNYRWNDFPLQPVFVPFVHETLRYLAASRATQTEYMVGDLPGPGGAMPGVTQQPGRRVAVNLDPREADPRRMTAEAFQAGISRLQAAGAQQAQAVARQQEDQQGLWWYGLVLMVVSLAAEGLLGRRLG